MVTISGNFVVSLLIHSLHLCLASTAIPSGFVTSFSPSLCWLPFASTEAPQDSLITGHFDLSSLVEPTCGKTTSWLLAMSDASLSTQWCIELLSISEESERVERPVNELERGWLRSFCLGLPWSPQWAEGPPFRLPSTWVHLFGVCIPSTLSILISMKILTENSSCCFF